MPRLAGRLALTLLFSTCLVASTASAQEYSRPGWYIGGGFGASFDFFESILEEEINLDFVDITAGWSANARVGYRWLKWLGFEFMYEGMYDMDIEVADVKFASSNYNSVLGNIKFIAPIKRFEPYFTLGFGAQQGDFDDIGDVFDTNRWDFVFRPGFGLDYYITEHWVVNGDLGLSLRVADYGELPSETTDNLTMTVGAGLAYRF